MASNRKRFCPRCETRVSRSANKCWHCGGRLFSKGRLGLMALTAVGLLLLIGGALSEF